MKPTQWTREESKERFPNALSPLGWSVLQSALDANLESIKKEFYLKKLQKDQVTRWVDGFLYSSRNFFKRIPLTHFRWLPLFGFAFRTVIHFTVSVFPSKSGESLKSRFFHRLYRKELADKIQVVISEWKSELPEHLKRFQKNKIASTTWNVYDVEFRKLLDKIEHDGCAYNRLDFSIYFYKNILKSLIEPSRLAILTSQSPFQIGRYISQIVQQSQKLTNGSSQFEYVNSHLGHLALSWDISELTFSEEPALISKMLNDPSNHPYSKPERNVASELEQQFIDLVSCDEEHRFYASYQFPYVRALLGKIAHEWTQKNILVTEKDLYYLTLPEVIQIHSDFIAAKSINHKDIQQKVKTRQSYFKVIAREILSSEEMRTQEDIFYVSHGPHEPLVVDPVQQWQGQKVSAGVTNGQAYWVTDYQSLSECPAHRIVLCETPSPNFHSAFVKAKAIVAETGGILSHGAIVARELEIPCVLQVRDLKNIKNDDWIEVDANFGIIKRLT